VELDKGFGFIVPIGKEGEEEVGKSIFVHLWNVVGSNHTNPINLREGARVQYKLGEQDGRARALEVVMLGKDGAPLPIHSSAQTLEEKRRSYYVTAESLGVRVHAESWPGKQLELRDATFRMSPWRSLGSTSGLSTDMGAHKCQNWFPSSYTRPSWPIFGRSRSNLHPGMRYQ